MKKNQYIVIGTAITAFIAAFFIMGSNTIPGSSKIDTQGQLHLGNPSSKVKVVLFIDFRCPACKRFETQVFPLLKRRYIDTNQIDYTVIPLAFLNGSQRLGEGYFCTRQQNPTLGQAYIEQVYQTGEVAALPGINSQELSGCLGSARASTYLERNRAIADQAMGRKVYTPTVFVNGKRTKDPSYTAVSSAIDEALK
ncbi:MAG: thioredoxin domain-containing protein [Chlamydiales bacterium]|nr:thioredoxin domain-containing protein [Chlamydiales bacterium]